MKTFKQLLIELVACAEAREWAGNKTIEQVVQECHRGDWLLWLAQKVGVELQPLTLAKGHCANTVRHLMTDERSLKAVDTSIDFGEGKATIEELIQARNDAVDAFSAAAANLYVAAHAAAAAAYVADAAADTAHATAAAAYAAAVATADTARAAAAATYAADAAADTAHAAAEYAAAATHAASAAPNDDARKENYLQTADICRKYIGDLIVKNVNKMLEAKQ